MLSLVTFCTPSAIGGIQNNLGEPFVFTGFPTSDGKGHYYSCAYGCAAAIPVTSKNKEGAWDFIKRQLLLEKQMTSFPTDGMPVHYEAFQRIVADELNPDFRAQYMDLINNTSKATCYGDSKLRDIIVESGQAFLAGDKGLEETVNIIQSRVGIFVAEQCG